MTDRPDEISIKVGLEIHQQLATNKKLFCNCKPIESEIFTKQFIRRLRAAKSELGKYDPAALFEKSKSKTIQYMANSQSSCLVEYDEEPPHELDDDAKEIALVISSALNSNILSEIHVMRKTVIDGSNTSGFQRTMLISQGGYLQVEKEKIGVQVVCLEEDAAKLLKDSEDLREYSLDRLGVPLVEIALEPVKGDAKDVKKIALSLGRLLRTTRKVTRGIGSIRQDVNISVNDNGVVEVKGVQQLDQLESIIDYESKRQHGLILIAEKIKNIKTQISDDDIFNITEFISNCNSKIIQKALKSKSIIKVIRVKGFTGIFGYEPYPGIRLGKEIGQQVRFFGIGGVFHSDELPNYGIEETDVKKLRELMKLDENDAFLIIAGDIDKIEYSIESIINRINYAAIGVPAETRGIVSNGETIFLRPRPGSSRMYPETDIPPISVTKKEIENAVNNIPKTWDESLKDIQEKFNLNKQLSEQLFDSDYLDLFEKICEKQSISPTFVASTLCSTITNLQRQGFESSRLTSQQIEDTFDLLTQNKITKESVGIIFQSIMSGKTSSVKDAISESAMESIDDSSLDKILNDIIEENIEFIKAKKEHSVGAVMGIAMKNVRGKASGEKVSKMLKDKINNIIK